MIPSPPRASGCPSHAGSRRFRVRSSDRVIEHWHASLSDQFGPQAAQAGFLSGSLAGRSLSAAHRNRGRD
eukprot:1699608-Rhodomonas_salina.1